MILVAVPTLRAQWTGVDAGILPTRTRRVSSTTGWPPTTRR